jgi:hypothetical protein
VSPRLSIVGDVHGYAERLRVNLFRARLIDRGGNWCAGDATFAALGDLVDRGSDGIGVINLLMRLQSQASQQGGQVHVLLGNHDVAFLAAHQFGEPFEAQWIDGGGQLADLHALEQRHLDWLISLPPLVLDHEHLLMHADSIFYLAYGTRIGDVNTRVREVLRSRDTEAWQALLDRFEEHFALQQEHNVDALLAAFGGRRIVHGHTPIVRMTHQPPQTVTEPLLYASGRCVNVDPGLYRGGPGFVFEALVD